MTWRGNSGGALDPPRHITASGQQAFDRDVLVEVFPVQAGAAQFDLVALGGRGMEEAGKPRERNAERAAITDRDPHRVLVERDLSRRNGHAMPISRC